MIPWTIRATAAASFTLLALSSLTLADTASNTLIRARPADIAAYKAGGNALTGNGVKIAQLDTEVSMWHPALVGRIESQTNFTSEGLLLTDTQFFNYVSGNNLVWINDFHGTAVAGVMVGTGLDSTNAQTGHVGVAPGAKVNVGKFWTSQLDKGDPVWGINSALSLADGAQRKTLIVEDQSFAGAADGNGAFALALDYLAFNRDVLAVLPGGNAGTTGAPFSRPADAYNGITVGATNGTQVVGFSNSGTTADGRRKPDVVAPGTNLNMPFGGWEDNDGRDASAAEAYSDPMNPANLANFQSPNINGAQDADPDYVVSQGTSFSAPHVAGQVALLREFGTSKGFDQHTQTLRAVIVNSANKLNNVLESNQTITSKTGDDWTQSDAYNNQTITLDKDMGAGMVDVYRSLKQYNAGQHGPTQNVPLIGWDYHHLGPEGNILEYTFDQDLTAGSWFSATLAWRREVTFTDVNNNGEYDAANDSFTALALDDLNLYLLPSQSDYLGDAVWSSVSTADNLEHMFFQITQTGDYKLVVEFKTDAASNETHYGLAWWTEAIPEPGTLAILAFAAPTLVLRRKRN